MHKTTKDGNKFYNIAMLKVLPLVLERFYKKEKFDQKFLNEKSMLYKHIFNIKLALVKHDWIGVIIHTICAYNTNGKEMKKK